jgi:hypothetical protein
MSVDAHDSKDAAASRAGKVSSCPPCLYAMYWLDPDKNGEIVSVVQSVVVEELLHMNTVSNVSSELVGSPAIYDRSMIPSHSDPLPGGINSQLTANRGAPKDLVGHAAVEHPAEPATAVRRHHDQVSLVACGGIQNGVDGILTADGCLSLDTVSSETHGRRLQVLLGAVGVLDLRIARVDARHRMRLHGLDQNDVGPGASSEHGGVRECSLCQR